MKTIDLHVHSCISDGTLTPEELVRLALDTGLSAFALTDHDTTDGIRRATAAAPAGLEVIPGIEFSTRWQHRDIHILGYYMDYLSTGFQDTLHAFVDTRNTRNERMCQRLQEHAGFPITVEKLQERWPDAVITRAHMAAWLVEQGLTPSRTIAFDKYLGDHASCFVPREQITPADAIRLIRQYRGIPVLAHPLLYSLSRKQLDGLVAELADAGLMGIEAVYVMNRGSDTAAMRLLAQKYSLLITGGSDFHGRNKPDIAMGTGVRSNLSIPYSLLDELKAARG
ncbi:MAG: PHP domain-containing protein [Clostridiales bacterium]|nr:PHP domain-containing protein [Clostridiales bacterium]